MVEFKFCRYSLACTSNARQPHLHPVARTAMRRSCAALRRSCAALTVIATIIGLDLVIDVGSTTFDDNGLAAAILDDVLLVTMPLVKKYEMAVIKQDEMSQVKG